MKAKGKVVFAKLSTLFKSLNFNGYNDNVYKKTVLEMAIK